MGTRRLAVIESWTHMKGAAMTVQVNYLNPFTTPGQLVTIMVRPVPTPEGLSEEMR